MKKIDFTKIKVFGSFEDEEAGRSQEINIAKGLANRMKYTGPVLLDIGFEELAHKIYLSTGPVEVPDEYIDPICECVRTAPYFASVKRSIINLLVS